MPDVRIAHKKLWIGDQPHALLSGEVHYWRLSPPQWQPILRQVRQLGLEIVATYVCWEYHEIAPGSYDFRGDTQPQRNLAGFLDLVAAENLWLILRPGPYIYSEWVNGGIPDRVVRYHRLHPEFKRAALDYMSAVSDVIRPYLATQGGPIILLQAENEADPWPQYYEAQLGLGEVPGPFQEFLRQRYESIARLNDAWETHLEDFNQARAVTQPALPQRGFVNRYLDFWRFRHAQIAEITRWAAQEYRRLGVDVPIVANTYTIYGIQNWRAVEQAVDLAGPDFYPSNEFRQDADEHRQFLHQVRYTASYSALPYIPEFEAGLWDAGPATAGFTANHYLLLGLSALLAGIAGWNWYMLVNRDNWYLSPINEWGRVRPDIHQTFARLVALFRQIDPPGLERLTDTAVTVDALHQAARLADSSHDLLRELYRADIDYDCFDVETGQVARPVLFYAGGAWLSRAAMWRLLDYVESGGNLVFFQNLPLQDDSLSPLQMPGVQPPSGILGAAYPQQLRVTLGQENLTLSSPAFYVFEDAPGERITAERVSDAGAPNGELYLHTELPAGQRYTVGYRVAYGAGRLTCLGINPTPAVIRALHRWFAIPLYCSTESEHTSTALFRHGEDYVVIAVNHCQDDRDAVIRLHPALFAGRPWHTHDLMTDCGETTALHETGRVTVHLPGKSGTVLKLSPGTL